AGELVQVLLRVTRLLSVALERGGVRAEVCLQRLVDVEGDGERGTGHEDAERGPEPAPARAQPLRDALPADRDQEENSPRPRRVEKSEENTLDANAVRSREHADGGEHRPGAGNEDEPEAGAEQEAAAEVAPAPPRKPRER